MPVIPYEYIDKITNALKVIELAHHEIHEGSLFELFASQITANADDNVTIITFKTPNTSKQVHIFPRANVSSAAWFRIYRAPTVVDNTGTGDIVAHNRNEQSSKTATILNTRGNPDTAGEATYWDETDGAGANITVGDGTLIHEELIGAGRNSFAKSRENGEWILAKNTIYAFVLENEGAAANVHNMHLVFYEQTPK